MEVILVYLAKYFFPDVDEINKKSYSHPPANETPKIEWPDIYLEAYVYKFYVYIRLGIANKNIIKKS